MPWWPLPIAMLDVAVRPIEFDALERRRDCRRSSACRRPWPSAPSPTRPSGRAAPAPSGRTDRSAACCSGRCRFSGTTCSAPTSGASGPFGPRPPMMVPSGILSLEPPDRRFSPWCTIIGHALVEPARLLLIDEAFEIAVPEARVQRLRLRRQQRRDFGAVFAGEQFREQLLVDLRPWAPASSSRRRSRARSPGPRRNSG